MKVKIISAVTVIIITVCTVLTAFAVSAADQTDLKLPAKSAILMEEKTGQILYEQNPDQRISPASITKIMALLLTFEALDDGRISYSDNVTISKSANKMGGSQIWLEEGEKMSVSDLVKAMAVVSANDATFAMAEHIAGTEAAFIEMMNKRAAELNLTNTSFKNTTGFDEDGHYTSARDVAVMAQALIKYPEIKKFSTIWMDKLRGGKSELINTNKLIQSYEGITGLKTGSTDNAKYCLCATAERDGISLISVVMGSNSSEERFDASKSLLDYGFATFSVFTDDLSKLSLTPVKVILGAKDNVQGEISQNPQILLKKGQTKQLKYAVIMSDDIMAPVEKGQAIGKIVYKIENEIVLEIPVKAVESVEKLTISGAYKKQLMVMFGVS